MLSLSFAKLVPNPVAVAHKRGADMTLNDVSIYVNEEDESEAAEPSTPGDFPPPVIWATPLRNQ